MQSHYEINVSLNGNHLFATSPRSCVDIHKAKEVFLELEKRFPENEGFTVTLTHWEVSGTRIKQGEINRLFKK